MKQKLKEFFVHNWPIKLLALVLALLLWILARAWTPSA